MTDKMTPEQAIKILKSLEPQLACEHITMALGVAVESLERQIPKKPNTKFYEQGGVISKCPVCGDWDGDWWFNKPKYCETCGQAIDWESDTDGI